MKRINIVFFTVLILIVNMAFTQDFNGYYQFETATGVVALKFEEGNKGNYIGELRGNNNVLKLIGTIQDGFLVGIVGEVNSGIVFQAAINDNFLTLSLIETLSDGTPNYNSAQSMMFEKTTGSSKQANVAQKAENVKINNIILNDKQISEIEETYGAKPMPGNYWYDSRSGLYGAVGYPAYGFMYSGHDFGAMDRYASGGNSGVVINGRELSQDEWAVWSITIKYAIQPGFYWMDDQGNAGYEGVDIPLVNLYLAAQQGNTGGNGGSGDKQWSSRFSAGNYDSGNQRGYVSVPGYGPVGYGF